MPPKGWRKPAEFGRDRPVKDPDPVPQRQYAATWAEDLANQLRVVPDAAFVDMLTRTGLTKEQQQNLIESFRRNQQRPPA